MRFYDRENEIRLLQESEKLSERAASFCVLMFNSLDQINVMLDNYSEI